MTNEEMLEVIKAMREALRRAHALVVNESNKLDGFDDEGAERLTEAATLMSEVLRLM